MADEADHAQELEQLALEHALARRVPDAALIPKGTCHNCGETIKPRQTKTGPEHVRIFCDKDCGDDYGMRRRANQQRRM